MFNFMFNMIDYLILFGSTSLRLAVQLMLSSWLLTVMTVVDLISLIILIAAANSNSSILFQKNARHSLLWKNWQCFSGKMAKQGVSIGPVTAPWDFGHP